MNLPDRVHRLERTDGLASPQVLWGRFQETLDHATLSLTGKNFSAILGDGPTVEPVMEECRDSFLAKLSDGDLEILTAEVAWIAFGDDTEAMEAAKRRALGLPAPEVINTVRIS